MSTTLNAPSSTDLKAAEFSTLAALVAAHANERPSAIAMYFEDEIWTWQELNTLSESIAARLVGGGLQPGENVGLHGLNTAMMVAALIGTLRAGGVAAFLTASATPAQISQMISDCGARIVFSTDSSSHEIPELPHVQFVALGDAARGISLEDWKKLAEPS